MMMIALSTITLILVAGLLAWMFWLGRPGHAAAAGFEPPSKEEMRRHLYLGLFYVNPDDVRGWVPKVHGIGVTVNFRTVRNANIFALLIVSVLVSAAALAAAALCGAH